MSKKYDYTFLLLRTDEEGMQTELINRDINADDAISFMIYALRKAKKYKEAQAEAEQSEKEPEEQTPEPKKKAGIGDIAREALKKEIKAGKRTVKDLAQEYNLTTASVYQIRSRMKKDGELEGKANAPESRPAEPEPTPAPAKTVPTVTIKPDEDPKTKQQKALFRKLTDQEKKAIRSFQDGMGVSEIYRNFPSITVLRINDLIQSYGQVEID